MAAQPPPKRPSVEARLADLCKELEATEAVAGEAAALLEEGKGALLALPSFASRSVRTVAFCVVSLRFVLSHMLIEACPLQQDDAVRLFLAFVLYCAAKLKGRKEGSGVRLCEILNGCKLKYDDFFKEAQQLGFKIEKLLESRYGQDWESRLELKQLESLVKLLTDASRFYRKAYNELFSSASNNKDSGSTASTPDYVLFGWLLFLMLRSRSPELFKDLVSCIHGLVAILAILLIHVPAKFRSFTIEVKQTEKGVDLLASLCHNYHTSEDCLKEMMSKTHKAIEDFFSIKALSALEFKTENLDKLDTGMGPSSLILFELDLKMFLTNTDYISTAENTSRGSTNLGCSKRVFETLASPTKTIKNMLTVPSSPSSPGNGGSVKIVQMTPVTSAMTTAKWLREVISSLPQKPSSKLQLQFLSLCDRDLTNDVTKRLVLATHKTVMMMFPAVLESTGLTAFDLSKIIENFVRHEETLPRELKRHLNSLEEQLLESMAWEKGSSLYNSLVVARPSLAPEINRLGLLAEPMPSLDDLVARQNIHVETLPDTPSKKCAGDPADNSDPQSPKRLCIESRNTIVERNVQTPPPKQSHMLPGSLKAKCHPLQSTFASTSSSRKINFDMTEQSVFLSVSTVLPDNSDNLQGKMRTATKLLTSSI
ncbi:hypothetical protein PR202_gb13289 [Eleusine coracana subsp. coracana]|uniref:Uncharacterized protein n=1 Tax=Eleusine coracana subsp. coracana TaxID=191504 RepID=A0AAV5ES21_ELECO|nr:hypothetical protein PR202_gb13289 [Eleusine coracana subsp. coracana]